MYILTVSVGIQSQGRVRARLGLRRLGLGFGLGFVFGLGLGLGGTPEAAPRSRALKCSPESNPNYNMIVNFSPESEPTISNPSCPVRGRDHDQGRKTGSLCSTLFQAHLRGVLGLDAAWILSDTAWAPSDTACAPSDTAWILSDTAWAPSDTAWAPSDTAWIPSDIACAPSDAACAPLDADSWTIGCRQLNVCSGSSRCRCINYDAGTKTSTPCRSEDRCIDRGEHTMSGLTWSAPDGPSSCKEKHKAWRQGGGVAGSGQVYG